MPTPSAIKHQLPRRTPFKIGNIGDIALAFVAPKHIDVMVFCIQSLAVFIL
jgi:hypothetical protein